MNERIMELAEQAGFAFPSFGDAYCSGSVRYSIEEFAELIVRECLSYAKEGDLGFMKFMIKRNFGVEE